MTIEARLAALEQNLAALSAELAAIRGELRSSAPEPPIAAPPIAPSRASPPPRERRARRVDSLNVEGLLGRYGMLAIAVLAAVAAVGTFLSWAITRGYLTLSPAARVLAGLAFASGIALWGMKLRRTERSFGSSMLGLALVIVQVCAYAAGPSFELVPTWVAFLGAAAVSWALAFFAHSENDEPLWCVGFGGAALAPFVTSDGSGNVYALAIYGLVVLLPACFAISHRDWPIGWRVFYLAAALFVGATGVEAYHVTIAGFIVALALPFVIAGAGVVPFAPRERKRGALRWLGLLAIPIGVVAHGARGEMWVAPGALIAAVVIWLALLDRHADVPQSSIFEWSREQPVLLDWIDAAVIPLLLSLQAVDLATPTDAGFVHLATAVAFVGFAWRRVAGPLRDAAAFGAVLSALGALEYLPLEQPMGHVAALLALGLAVLGMHKLRPSRTWLFSGGAVLLYSAGLTVAALAARPIYQFSPFATEASATALLVTIALAIVARFWYWVRVATRASITDRAEWMYAGSLRQIVRGVTVAPWVWGFLWIMIELWMAYSPSTSTLLLVIYFAATAVGCVAVGRARHSARLRQVGLGLALVAAATAFFGATSYFDIGIRIAAYLVTSAFLLGIAYWYRRPGTLEEAT